jgi:DNA-binding GntR family transcriptional regulator
MLAGMFAVMAHLEMLCAGLSAVMMSPRERHSLEQMHEMMAALVRSGDLEAYAIANEAFHSAIYEGTKNAYLAEITANTRLRLQAFRRAQFAAIGRIASSHAEHGLIVEAILRGERVAAETAMRAHIGQVEDAWQHLSSGFHAEAEMKARQDL